MRGRDVPIPPGVEPEVLAPRVSTDPVARLTFDEAVRGIAAATAPTGTASAAEAPPIDPDERERALRHYIRGRDASFRNAHLEAVTELEKAAAIDPSDPAILRQLARSYLAVHNGLRATGFYERLLVVEPDDSEALFMLGLAATNRQEFERAVGYLSRPHLRGASFEHDPAADYLSRYMIASSLRQLGYDRAWIESARTVLADAAAPVDPTLYAAQAGSLYKQRADVWRAVGDSHCRLSEYEPALDAYRQAAGLPNADPDALHPRVIYANLRLGREWTAQQELLAALGDGTAPVSERDIGLCAYVAQHVTSTELLADAVVERQRAYPDDPTFVRAAAVLLPPERSLALLRDFLDRRPEDMAVVGQLLAWQAARDEAAAIDLAIALGTAHPMLAYAYGDRLATAGPGRLPYSGSAPSPAAAVIAIRLLMYRGADGAAWSVCSEALRSWPADQALCLQQIELAARLGEPRLLQEAIDASRSFDDVPTWLARARARRALDRTGLAVDAAQRAAELAPGSAKVQTELALAHLGRATGLTDADGRREHAGRAQAAAQRAVEADPARDEGYEVLFALYATNGPMANRALLDDTGMRLADANPGSRLLSQLAARQDVRSSRPERALERLLVLCDANPTDAESLGLAVTVWLQLGRSDAALRWLDRHLADRPADPVLLGQWTAVELQLGRPDEVVERLKRVVREDPAHDAARLLMESAYRSMGQIEPAVTLAEERLASRPPGVRRELELAALYAGAGKDDLSYERLRWIKERSDDATFDILVSALGVTGRLDERQERHQALALEYAVLIVDRYPEAPLQVYGSGLKALAKMGRIDEHFDDLVERAVRHAAGASGPTIEDADLWRQLAQALVDADQPGAAGRALRARLQAEAPLDPLAQALLTTVALVSDAAANDPEASIALVRSLAEQKALPVIPGRETEPTVAEMLYEASICFTILGNEAGAERLLRESVRLAPDHAMALNNLGYTRLELGFNDEDTRLWIERAHELNPDDSNVLDTVGWLRYKTGRFEGDAESPGAVALIRDALAKADEPSPEVLDHLGDALWRTGDAKGAVDAWSLAVKLLEDDRRREQEQELFRRLQTQAWGLLVADAAELYERQYGSLLARMRRKVEEAESGGQPRVAGTFEETRTGDQPGGLGDGRP